MYSFLRYTTHPVGPVLALPLISHQEFRTVWNSESDGNYLASWQVTKNPCMKLMLPSFEIWRKKKRQRFRKKKKTNWIAERYMQCKVHIQDCEYDWKQLVANTPVRSSNCGYNSVDFTVCSLLQHQKRNQAHMHQIDHGHGWNFWMKLLIQLAISFPLAISLCTVHCSLNNSI